MRRIATSSLGAGALAVGLALSATPAHAVLVLSATIGTTTFTCVDNTACDSDPAVGTLALGSTTTPINIGGVNVLGSVTTSTGTAANPAGGDRLSSSSLSVTNVSGATQQVTVAFGDTNFIGPAFTFTTSGSGTFVNDIGGVLSLNYYDDPANRQGATTSATTPGNLIDTFTSATANSNSFSVSHNNAGTLATPDGALYSMTEQFSFNLIPGGQLISRGQTEQKFNTTPEPASLAVLGTVLCGLGWLRRRNRV